jgi:hypothetical protein
MALWVEFFFIGSKEGLDEFDRPLFLDCSA